jgi:hypothetical protein
MFFKFNKSHFQIESTPAIECLFTTSSDLKVLLGLLEDSKTFTVLLDKSKLGLFHTESVFEESLEINYFAKVSSLYKHLFTREVASAYVLNLQSPSLLP